MSLLLKTRNIPSSALIRMSPPASTPRKPADPVSPASGSWKEVQGDISLWPQDAAASEEGRQGAKRPLEGGRRSGFPLQVGGSPFHHGGLGATSFADLTGTDGKRIPGSDPAEVRRRDSERTSARYLKRVSHSRKPSCRYPFLGFKGSGPCGRRPASRHRACRPGRGSWPA